MKRTVLAVMFLSLVGAVPAVADSTVYSSGSSNYNYNGWGVDDGLVVTDEFTLSSPETITGFTFVVWAYPGDSLSSVNYSLDTTNVALEEYNSTGSEAGTTVSTTSVLDESNMYGFDIYTETVTGLSVSLSAGTDYYLTLQNAVVTNGDPIYWDENDGLSTGYENSVGSIGENDCTSDDGCGLSGGETFTLTAASVSTTPEPNSLLLFGTGIVGLAFLMRRRFAKAL